MVPTQSTMAKSSGYTITHDRVSGKYFIECWEAVTELMSHRYCIATFPTLGEAQEYISFLER